MPRKDPVKSVPHSEKSNFGKAVNFELLENDMKQKHLTESIGKTTNTTYVFHRIDTEKISLKDMKVIAKELNCDVVLVEKKNGRQYTL